MLRGLGLGAGLGADSNPERQLISDYLTENYYYWLAMKAHKDCHSDLSAASGTWSNSQVGAVFAMYNQGFMDAYNAMGNYVAFMMTNHLVSREQLPGAYASSAHARLGTDGWPNSIPPAYSSGFSYYTWDNLGEQSFGKCRADFIGPNGGLQSFGTADANVILDTSNGKLVQYRSEPCGTSCGDVTMYNLTPGDKVKLLQANSSEAGNSNELSTGLAPTMNAYGPSQLNPALWYCPVNINNATGTFQLAPGLGPAPNECSSVGATITSFSGMVEGGPDRTAASTWYDQSDLPSGFNLATSWVLFHFFAFRLQDPNFDPNPTYVWWAVNGVCAQVSAGFAGTAPYCSQGRAYTNVNIPIPVVSGSNSAFDWNEAIVPPRKP